MKKYSGQQIQADPAVDRGIHCRERKGAGDHGEGDRSPGAEGELSNCR